MRLPLLLLTAALWADDVASDKDAHWPQWRGPHENGIARTAAPVEWTAANVRWKAEIPGRAHSTPVIWGERLFLTTAVPTAGEGTAAEHRLDVMCLDRRTGKVLWTRTVKTVKPHEGYHARYGSFASNSPVTDGRRVYASFGSRGVYALDFNGKPVWSYDAGVEMHMRNAFGEGVAPVMHENKLLVIFDSERNSFLAAIDKNTGKELWRKQRDEISNWAAPLVVTHEGKKQVVVAAPNKVRSYDFVNGNLIWECAGLGLNTIPIPIHSGGMVYVMSGFRNPNLLAIKLGRTGDLTGTGAIVWQNNRGNSYTASPLLKDGRLFFITDSGMVSCLNAATGEPFYRQVRLPKSYNFKASPVLAGDKVYLASEEGDVIVLAWSEKMEVLATNTFPDEFFVASPVVAENTLYLRGRNTLYAIR